MGCSASQTLFTANSVPTNKIFEVQEPKSVFTDEEKIIIKKQWKVLSLDVNELGTAVFKQIFREYPEIKELFPCRDIPEDNLLSSAQFRAHSVIFMQAVGAVVDNLDDLDTVMSNPLIFLGKQHAAYTGLKRIYFDEFYHVISKVWKEVLGLRYTIESEKSWSHVFMYITSKLKKGYRLA